MLPKGAVRITPPIGIDRRNGVETLFHQRNYSGRRMIGGLASNDRPVAGVVLLNQFCLVKFPVPLFVQHDATKEVGEVVYVRKSSTGVYVRAVVFSAADWIWQQIERGMLRGLSVLSVDQRLAEHRDGVNYVAPWRLAEVSICPVGANVDCTFSVCRG